MSICSESKREPILALISTHAVCEDVSMVCKDDQISMMCDSGNSEKSDRAGNVSEAMMDQSKHTKELPLN